MKILLSVDRSIDRQRSDFRPLGIAVHRSVDHCSQPASKALCQLTGAVDRTELRAKLLQSVDAQSIEVYKCTLVHVDRPLGRPTEQFCSAYGRPVSQPTLGQKLVMEIF